MKFKHFLIKSSVQAHDSARRLASMLDYLLWTVFDMNKFRHSSKKVNKILVVSINSDRGNIGGDFCTLGVLNQLKKENPKLQISVLANKHTVKQFGKVPGLDVIEYKGKKTISDLREKKFDAGILLTLGPLNSREFNFIPMRIGRSSHGISGFFKTKNKLGYTRKVHNSMNEHMVDLRLKMLKAVGLQLRKRELVFHSSKQEEEKVRKFLKKNKVGKFIVIHPGGKHVTESWKKGEINPHLWPIDRYAKVIDHFSKRYKIIITGSKDEDLLVEEIRKLSNSKDRIISACGKLSIRESGSLLKKAKLLIATDTSIVHLAYQVKTPIVELMGPSYPEVVGAWPINSKKHDILFDDGPLAKSMRKKNSIAGIVCLGKISVEDVISASEKMLKKFR